MKVYVVTSPSDPRGGGDWIEGVYTSIEKAMGSVVGVKEWDPLTDDSWRGLVHKDGCQRGDLHGAYIIDERELEE